MDDVVKIGLVIAMFLAAGTFLIVMVSIAVRNLRKANPVGSESGSELEALRAEVDELRNLPPRMAELEERLDFAERLLAQRDAERLPRGKED